MMTKIKICGLTTPADIAAANRLLPDYAGFVFAKSPREVGTDAAKELVSALDTRIKSVGVFVNQPIDAVLRVAAQVGLTVIQLHGEESRADMAAVKQAGLSVWKAVRMRNADSVRLANDALETADCIVADAYAKGVYGGTGAAFDWAMLSALPKERLVLAGGLTPETVQGAIAAVRPFCVDVSSGVETDGVKDAKKMEDFITRGKHNKHD
jgi:phosphoribosylanthranilate isomerase